MTACQPPSSVPSRRTARSPTTAMPNVRPDTASGYAE